MTAKNLKPTALETVRTLERRRIEATGSNDVAALAPLLDDDLIYINSVGEVFDKERYLHALETHRLAYDKDFDVHESEFRALDGLVILVGIMLGHSRLDGEQQVFHFRCISVWREQGGTWRMVAWQSSSSSFTEDQLTFRRSAGPARNLSG
ncbi:MAG TPA: nuclear transport factor 2 family protein [Sphingomicrobium sp.]|nr:nuclear transport factor 2 family protein [Sphingomicrobium sp.]